MNTFLNKLLHPEFCELVDYSAFMCTQSFIDSLNVHTVIGEPSVKNEPMVKNEPSVKNEPIRKNNNDWFTPKQDNTLFWCVFISVYGYSEYLNIGSKYVNAELEEKQQMIESLQKQPSKLKEGNYRITNQTIQELLSGLMVCKRDHLFSLVAFSIFYQRNIFVTFDNHTYVRFSPTKEENYSVYPSTVINCRVGGRNNIYSLWMSDEFKHEIDTKLPLEHYTRPLRGISSYTLPQLWSIATTIHLTAEPNTKKTELYEKIAAVCSLESVIRNSA